MKLVVLFGTVVVVVTTGLVAVTSADEGRAANSAAARGERSSLLGLTLVAGSTQKVEQLVADIDRETKRPT